MCRKNGDPPPGAAGDPAPPAAPLPIADDPLANGPGIDNSDHQRARNDAQGNNNNGGGEGGAGFDFREKQKENAKHRASVRQFLNEDPEPLAQMLPFSLQCNAMSKHIGSILELAGEKWEHRQDANQARVVNEGGGGMGRTYRTLVAYDAVLETKTVETLTNLMNDYSKWRAMPASGKTRGHEGRTFIGISRLICEITRQIKKQRRFPNKLLTALRDFEFLKWIREEKFCMMDDHSEEFVKAFTPPEKHEDAAAILEERAAMDRDENVEIETLHATIRRLLKYYSLQTHKRKFKQMNADWTLRRMRKYSREPAKAADLPKPHTQKT